MNRGFTGGNISCGKHECESNENDPPQTPDYPPTPAPTPPHSKTRPASNPFARPETAEERQDRLVGLEMQRQKSLENLSLESLSISRDQPTPVPPTPRDPNFFPNLMFQLGGPPISQSPYSVSAPAPPRPSSVRRPGAPTSSESRTGTNSSTFPPSSQQHSIWKLSMSSSRSSVTADGLRTNH